MRFAEMDLSKELKLAMMGKMTKLDVINFVLDLERDMIVTQKNHHNVKLFVEMD